jgi:hypothetical protein
VYPQDGMTFTIERAAQIFSSTRSADVVPALTARFKQLSPTDQLALIWFAYLEMGKTLTIAATGAARMEFAERTLNEIKQMTFPQQSQVMRDLAEGNDTPISRTYSCWSVNIKLGFWYELAQWMNQGIVAPIPPDYQMSPNAAPILTEIKTIEPGQQITILRNFVVDMGFDPAKLEKAERIAEPLVAPTALADRQGVSIAGIENQTVIDYMNLLNANDFDNLIELFLADGALQPPFQRPIVGKEKVLRFFREDCQNLKLLPEQGVSENSDGGFTQIKVTGKVQTPWFGAGVGMNVAWRFLLDPQGKIYFVAIDLLASPKELLNFVR